MFRIAEVSNTGDLTLTRVTLNGGSMLGSGGGVLNRGAVTFTSAGSGLTNNLAMGTGGGLSNTDTPLGTAPAATFTGATVLGNTAGGRGGEVYNGVRDALTMTSSVVTTNRSLLAQGGGIAASTSTTSLTSTPVSANIPNNCVGSSPAVPNCTAWRAPDSAKGPCQSGKSHRPAPTHGGPGICSDEPRPHGDAWQAGSRRPQGAVLALAGAAWPPRRQERRISGYSWREHVRTPRSPG